MQPSHENERSIRTQPPLKNAERRDRIKPSTTPTGRALGFERGVVTVIALIAVLLGAAVLLVGTGWLGLFRAQRPLADPILVQWLSDNSRLALVIAIVLGVLLFALGLWWVIRALRPESRPDVRLERGSAELTVTAAALTEAVRADAEQVTGVNRAHVRMAGDERRPSLRLTLSLQEGTNVRQVWEDLDAKVLSRAREALGTDTLPTAIRLRLDRAPRQRVR
ncbi:alkaline shock response membrane anchor protein AmaP [Saccharopolyspora indica]|uniref:alkaline shock response membrane anchor protein AmaP n=1 Tax=Saccharopolyspora indica TaxID=1229659 RepID=UPI0022EB7C45|nr:alkaline shock response membrane anchor protein AmaP [Saccharopolyspora indica]MDA3649530.1 alkaline shock response membrane anchor protein AmaP [Saccharopolyspora indica]